MNDIDSDIIDLLVLRATQGLSDADAKRLLRRLEECGLQDTTALDLAAAAATNAFALRESTQHEEAPAHLKASLTEGADRYFKLDNVVAMRKRPAPRKQLGINWGWAAAAMIVIAVFASSNFDFTTPGSLEAERDVLLANDSSRIMEWGPPDDPRYANVSGDVVWNDELQQGYMLLSNMPINDPAISQYQLWVVDPDRDANPVDGGVFDIPGGAETVIVPIDVKLLVSRPDAFAITREQPGGVVVSKGPLLVVAAG